MSRRVKEFIDISEHISLDELIGKLVEIRESLPDEVEAELRLRGDEVFGRRITITYFRDATLSDGSNGDGRSDQARDAGQPR